MHADMDHIEQAVATCEAGSMQCIVTGDRKARAELLELMNTLKEDL